MTISKWVQWYDDCQKDIIYAVHLSFLTYNCFYDSILWMSEAGAVQFAKNIDEVVLFFLGVYRSALHSQQYPISNFHSWEFLITLWFEYSLFSGRISFRWPLVRVFMTMLHLR